MVGLLGLSARAFSGSASVSFGLVCTNRSLSVLLEFPQLLQVMYHNIHLYLQDFCASAETSEYLKVCAKCRLPVIYKVLDRLKGEHENRFFFL